MSEQPAWVELNRQQRERLQNLVNRLSDEDLLRPLPGDGAWTVADALGHLAFYDRRAGVLIEKFARESVTASPFDAQTINDALLPLTRSVPPRAIAEEAIAAAEAADRASAGASAALLARIKEFNEVTPERWIHRKSHLDDIEAALDAG